MNRRLFLCSLIFAVVAGLHPTLARSAQKDLNRSDHFPSAEGKVVTIDGADLDISVRSADVPDIQVETELHIGGVGDEKGQKWIDSHTPVFTDGAKALTVTVDADKIGFLGFGYLSAKARLIVLAPSRIVPDLTTTSGGIHVRGDFPMPRPCVCAPRPAIWSSWASPRRWTCTVLPGTSRSRSFGRWKVSRCAQPQGMSGW
jgi:hypothetical protein